MATYRRSYLFRLGCEPPLYLWSGIGDLDVPANSLDPEGARYKGLGALIGIPAMKQLINGLALRDDFTLSGVSGPALRAAIEDRASVNGATVHLGYVDFDADWQLVAGPIWQRRGKAAPLTTDSKDTDRGRERTLSLSVAFSDTFRANPVLALWTDADQRRRSPDDAIFNHVAGIDAGTTRRWGPK